MVLNASRETPDVYDPVGLLTPITSRLKLDFHDLCLEDLDWDDDMPDSYLEKWILYLNGIQLIKELKFCCTTTLPGASPMEFELIISSDASKSIAVVSVHTRVPLTSGEFSCQLLTAKNKIVCYNTVPRAELRAAVMSASLAHFVQFHLRDQVSDSVYVPDSTVVLRWLNYDKRPLGTAVRNLVVEILRLSDIKQWHPGEKKFGMKRMRVRSLVVVYREAELDLYQILEQAAQHVPLSPDSDL